MPYTTVYVTHTPGASELDLLDNQEDANTERYVFEKLSTTGFQLLWRYRARKIGPEGCDVHPSYTGAGTASYRIVESSNMVASNFLGFFIGLACRLFIANILIREFRGKT